MSFCRTITFASVLLIFSAVIFRYLFGYWTAQAINSGVVEQNISPTITNRLLKRAISMAWRCSGTSNKELIENLSRSGLIKNERVKQAMIGVSETPDSSSLCGHDPWDLLCPLPMTFYRNRGSDANVGDIYEY